MDYGAILSRAWKITWNNKILWLFGLFAGTGASFNFRGGGSRDGNGGFTGGPGGADVQRQIERLLDRPEVVAAIVAVAALVILIAIAFFILSVIARGGLIGGIRIADDNGQVTFGDAWSIGLRYFWRMLGMVLLLIAPILLLALLAVVIGLLTFGLGLVCLLPLICVFVILYIPYAGVIWLGQIGVVVEDLKVFDGMKRGWELLKTNIGPVIIVGLLLFVIGFLIGFVVLVPLVVIAIPAIVAFMANPRDPNIPLIVGSIVAFLCFLPVLWVLSGMINTWIYSVWTLVYRELTGHKPAPLPPSSEVVQPA